MYRGGRQRAAPYLGRAPAPALNAVTRATLDNDADQLPAVRAARSSA